MSTHLRHVERRRLAAVALSDDVHERLALLLPKGSACVPEHRARLPAQEAMPHCGGMPRSAALRPLAPRSAPLCSTMQPRAPGVAVRAYTRAHALRHTQPHTYTCSRLFWRRLMCSRDPGTIESDAFSNCSTALLSASCTPDRRRESNDGNRRRTVPCAQASGTAISRAAVEQRRGPLATG